MQKYKIRDSVIISNPMGEKSLRNWRPCQNKANPMGVWSEKKLATRVLYSAVKSRRNKEKISQKYKRILWCKKHSTSYPGKNTLFQVSVKSTLPNC